MSAPTGLSHTRSDTAGKAHLLIPFAEVVVPITPSRPQSLAEMLLLTLICKESNYCRKRQMGRLIWTTPASLVLPVTVHRYLRQTALASVIANPGAIIRRGKRMVLHLTNQAAQARLVRLMLQPGRHEMALSTTVGEQRWALPLFPETITSDSSLPTSRLPDQDTLTGISLLGLHGRRQIPSCLQNLRLGLQA